MSRVSIAASQKPKPKETFKFLRRDEGRLSYATSVAESPSKGGGDSATPRVNRDRRDSRSLREAIAYDMKNAKSHDPFGEVVIAVPKKAPPPNRNATASEENRPTPPTKRAAPRTASKVRPEWVDPVIPVQREPEPRRTTSGDYSGAYQEPAGSPAAPPSANDGYEPYSDRAGAPTNGRRSDDFPQRYADPPRRSGATPRRYADPAQEDYERNYFRRGPQGPAHDEFDGHRPAPGRSRADEELMLQLEQEVRSAQEERAQYTAAKQQLDREKQRFESYRFATQQQLDDERGELEAMRLKEQRAAQKDVKSIEERYRSVSGLLSTERETNRKVMQENDTLRAQLEELTATMREQQKAHKAETSRMRRDIESLTTRNSELLAMTKEQQLERLSSVAAAAPSTRASSSRARSQPYAASEQQQQQQPLRASPPPVYSDSYIDSEAYEDAEPDNGEDSADSRSAGGRPAPVVMDFTPRGTRDAAKERRAQEMEARMRREEEAAQRRRQEREREAEERRARELAEAEEQARAEEEEAAERQRQRVAAARKRKEAAEELRANKKREAEERPAREVSHPPEEAAKARRSAGHPPNTPRLPATTAVVKKKPQKAVKAAGAAAKEQPHIPTREELVGDAEAMPSEECPNDEIVSQTAIGDNPNKREVLYHSGKREIHYANGTRKVVLPSGHTILHFTNGDVKCTFPSGKSTYWYDAAQTMHTQNLDGVQVFEFNATGQTERHLADGTKEILYPDGIFKVVKTDGTDETFFPEDN